MYPGELGRSLLLLLLFYSPTMSLWHLLFSGLCPWEQNKLNIFFLQPLMNINAVFIYCLAEYDKNKNALQRKRTCKHPKYLATVRILVSSSLSINCTLDKHAPHITSSHNSFYWPFLKSAAGSLVATCRIPINFKVVQFCHAEARNMVFSDTQPRRFIIDFQTLRIFPQRASYPEAQIYKTNNGRTALFERGIVMESYLFRTSSHPYTAWSNSTELSEFCTSQPLI